MLLGNTTSNKIYLFSIFLWTIDFFLCSYLTLPKILALEAVLEKFPAQLK